MSGQPPDALVTNEPDDPISTQPEHRAQTESWDTFQNTQEELSALDRPESTTCSAFSTVCTVARRRASLHRPSGADQKGAKSDRDLPRFERRRPRPTSKDARTTPQSSEQETIFRASRSFRSTQRRNTSTTQSMTSRPEPSALSDSAVHRDSARNLAARPTQRPRAAEERSAAEHRRSNPTSIDGDSGSSPWPQPRDEPRSERSPSSAACA